MKKYVVSVASIILFVILLEACSHLLLWVETRNSSPLVIEVPPEEPLIKFIHEPYLHWKSKPFLQTPRFSTNSLGYRGKEWQKQKPDNTLRIIMTGGSAAFGLGASSDDTTIQAYLATYLHDHLPSIRDIEHIEVLNMAQNGYTSSQELIQWREIITLKPDIVIHYTGFNDMYTGLLSRKAGWNHPFIFDYSFTTGERMQTIKTLFARELDVRLSKYSAFYRLIKTTMHVGKNEFNRETYTESSDIARVFDTNIRLIQDLATQEKIPTFIVLQPTLFTGNKTLTPHEIIRKQSLIAYVPGVDVYIPDVYSDLSDVLRKRIHMNIPYVKYIDGTTFLDNFTDTVYFDWVHLFDNGYEIVAQKLGDAILNNLR